ncbi:MAG: hypothetical protein V4722_25415 [Bacteroidota bacterium]
MQLNSILFIEYVFEDQRLDDTLAYTKLLQEYEIPCGEKIHYLLYRPTIFSENSYDKYENLFIEEVLNGIIENCKIIRGLMGS